MKSAVYLNVETFSVRWSWLTCIDPRVKFALAFALIVNIMLATSAVFPAMVMVVCLVNLRGIKTRLLFARFAPALGFALVLGVVQVFCHGSTPLVEFSIFDHHASINREGLEYATLLGARLLAATSVLMLFVSTTMLHELFIAMRWLRIPGAWVDVSMLTARYIFVLADTAHTVAEAQNLRLGNRGIVHKLVSAGTLAGTVLLKSMDQAAATHQAMILRGYDDYIAVAPRPPLGRIGWIALVTALVMPTAIMLLIKLFKLLEAP